MDAYVSALITAARDRVEIFLRRALITQVFECTIDDSRRTTARSTCEARSSP